ncbi:MAG: rod-binding protein [Rhodothalassiaceae bacterium]
MDAGTPSLPPVDAFAALEGHTGARLKAARHSLETAAKADGSTRERAMRKAAEDFEAVFLGQMLRPMFKGLATDGLFGGGHAEEIYRSLLIDEMGRSIAKSGGVGIADAVYRELVSIQEAQQ